MSKSPRPSAPGQASPLESLPARVPTDPPGTDRRNQWALLIIAAGLALPAMTGCIGFEGLSCDWNPSGGGAYFTYHGNLSEDELENVFQDAGWEKRNVTWVEWRLWVQEGPRNETQGRDYVDAEYETYVDEDSGQQGFQVRFERTNESPVGSPRDEDEPFTTEEAVDALAPLLEPILDHLEKRYGEPEEIFVLATGECQTIPDWSNPSPEAKP